MFNHFAKKAFEERYFIIKIKILIILLKIVIKLLVIKIFFDTFNFFSYNLAPMSISIYPFIVDIKFDYLEFIKGCVRVPVEDLVVIVKLYFLNFTITSISSCTGCTKYQIQEIEILYLRALE